jgi:hypothetical protein
MTDPDPEKILQMLDTELALARSRHRSGASSRNAVRIFSIVFILAATAAALAVLQYMVSDLQGRAAAHEKPPVEKQDSQMQAR